jgi:molybdopterin converting factor small subunit
MKITINFFASSRQVAGVEKQVFDVQNSNDLVKQLNNLGGEKLINIIKGSSILVEGNKVDIFNENQLKDNLVIEILPPFAGG